MEHFHIPKGSFIGTLLTANDEGGVAEGGESGTLSSDVRLQGVRLRTLPLDVLVNWKSYGCVMGIFKLTYSVGFQFIDCLNIGQAQNESCLK